ncbi:acyltransferase [Rickettsia endosymbiont of Halotydeus destructor]
MKIGNFVHIASFCSINGGDHFEIQDFTAISSGSRIVTKTDDFKNWGFGNSTIPEKYRNIYQAPIIIEKFSIIGSNCVILPGVTIGEGVAVGAGSIVSKNLEPWGVYLGNKRVRERDKAGVMATYDKFLNGY